MSIPDECVKVVIRVRPESQLLDAITPENGGHISINTSRNLISVARGRKGVSEFTFSGIRGPTASQEDLYSDCSFIVENVVQGINCCVMAYGQTGSGKTYSMLGEGWEEATSLTTTLTESTASETVFSNSLPVPIMTKGDEEFGVIPRCVMDLFAWLDENANEEGCDFSLDCQLLQIYNEKIYDLLQDRKRETPLQLRETARGSHSSVHVAGLSSYRALCVEDVLRLVRRGARNRAVRGTDENAESSRSHSVLQLNVVIETNDEVTRASLSLVDLAGSEKWRPSLAQAGNANSDEQKEQSSINSSLHALGTCVSALLEPGRKHIPFRNSALTRLLQDSLSGVGRTVLIATVREGAVYSEETLSTLQFAARAARIRSILVSLDDKGMGSGHSKQGSSSSGKSLQGLRRLVGELRLKIVQLQQQLQQQDKQPPRIQEEEDQVPHDGNVDGVTGYREVGCAVCLEFAVKNETMKETIRILSEENKTLREQLLVVMERLESSTQANTGHRSATPARCKTSSTPTPSSSSRKKSLSSPLTATTTTAAAPPRRSSRKQRPDVTGDNKTATPPPPRRPPSNRIPEAATLTLATEYPADTTDGERSKKDGYSPIPTTTTTITGMILQVPADSRARDSRDNITLSPPGGYLMPFQVATSPRYDDPHRTGGTDMKTMAVMSLRGGDRPGSGSRDHASGWGGDVRGVEGMSLSSVGSMDMMSISTATRTGSSALASQLSNAYISLAQSPVAVHRNPTVTSFIEPSGPSEGESQPQSIAYTPPVALAPMMHTGTRVGSMGVVDSSHEHGSRRHPTGTGTNIGIGIGIGTSSSCEKHGLAACVLCQLYATSSSSSLSSLPLSQPQSTRLSAGRILSPISSSSSQPGLGLGLGSSMPLADGRRESGNQQLTTVTTTNYNLQQHQQQHQLSLSNHNGQNSSAVDSRCGVHGLTNCLLCQLRGAEANNSNANFIHTYSPSLSLSSSGLLPTSMYHPQSQSQPFDTLSQSQLPLSLTNGRRHTDDSRNQNGPRSSNNELVVVDVLSSSSSPSKNKHTRGRQGGGPSATYFDTDLSRVRMSKDISTNSNNSNGKSNNNNNHHQHQHRHAIEEEDQESEEGNGDDEFDGEEEDYLLSGDSSTGTGAGTRSCHQRSIHTHILQEGVQHAKHPRSAVKSLPSLTGTGTVTLASSSSGAPGAVKSEEPKEKKTKKKKKPKKGL
eukprot:gene6511-13150_t